MLTEVAFVAYITNLLNHQQNHSMSNNLINACTMFEMLLSFNFACIDSIDYIIHSMSAKLIYYFLGMRYSFVVYDSSACQKPSFNDAPSLNVSSLYHTDLSTNRI